MYLTGLAHKAKFLLNQNSSTILTGVGVVGTVGTAYLTGRGSIKAIRILDDAKHEVVEGSLDDSRDRPVVFRSLSRFEVVKLTWKFYLPAVGTGVVTVSSIVFAHRIDAKRVVALTVASGISERALKEYREKVVEKLGERQDTKLRDEIAQNRVDASPPSKELVITGNGQVLCLDGLTGRYFMSTMEELKSAENKINYIINNHMGASLSEFYDEIGLAPTSYSDEVGWNPDQLIVLKISATMSQDSRPCMVVDFHPAPFANYWTPHE
jgi:hypothetical protein